jgi:hypothetical protein
MLPLPPLRFENLLLGSEPARFVLGGFTTTAFIQFVGPRPYQVLPWHCFCKRLSLARATPTRG